MRSIDVRVPAGSLIFLLPLLDVQSETEGDDNLYEGWAEYYFDETNFQGRNEWGQYLGNSNACGQGGFT